MKLPINVKPLAIIVSCIVFVGGVSVGLNTVNTSSHSRAELVKSASATGDGDTTPSDNPADPAAPGDTTDPATGASTSSTTGTGSTGSTGSSGTTTTPADPSPTPEPTPAPTVTNTWQTKADDGSTTRVTCHYDWSDGSNTEKFVGAYPDVQPDPSNGFQGVVINFTCT